MNFRELRIELKDCLNLEFTKASDRLQNIIFSLPKSDIIELISEIGTIPEDIKHDSTEEKIYTKTSDILLAKSLKELNLESTVLQQRSNCADIVAQSRYHNYSLVADAKTFRLSRTAKNAKDYKVTSMSQWRGDCDYSVLVCPFFQYPKSKSQIYKEALNNNISLFSWEYLYILLKLEIKESPTINLSQLWNQSATISESTSVAESDSNFLHIQSSNIANLIKISEQSLNNYFNETKAILINRGNAEIKYFESEIERIYKLERENAINELLKALKLDTKIATIKSFIDKL
jgi:type II restriction enzyme